MSLDAYNLIGTNFKTPLAHSEMRLTAANKIDLENMGVTLITFKMGTEKYVHAFVVVKFLSTPIILGFDFITVYKIGLYWGDEGRGYLMAGKERITLDTVDTIHAQVYLTQSLQLKP